MQPLMFIFKYTSTLKMLNVNKTAYYQSVKLLKTDLHTMDIPKAM